MAQQTQVTEEQARALAEESRERGWQKTSFAKELCLASTESNLAQRLPAAAESAAANLQVSSSQAGLGKTVAANLPRHQLHHHLCRPFPALDWVSDRLTNQRYLLSDNITATSMRLTRPARSGRVARKALRATKASRAEGRAWAGVPADWACLRWWLSYVRRRVLIATRSGRPFGPQSVGPMPPDHASTKF